ncbi:hypothetical protein [Thalassotalea maritima]|uniref:hypothetical protein n=1 Tax=Thalassotalea maritima TaxID=3242416 RepID=UPI0035272D7C
MYHRQQAIGNWHRAEHDSDENYSEFAQLFADGSFSFTFYTYKKDGTLIEEMTEIGDWGIVGNIHFTITKGEIIDRKQYDADMDNEDNYQAYKIVELTDKKFTYQHVITGESYTLQRVAGD